MAAESQSQVPSSNEMIESIRPDRFILMMDRPRQPKGAALPERGAGVFSEATVQ
ncbi:hypothetical protein [Rhizobium sp. YS-1r]|uniref:hypothetical protein n=1 Tax=Rhizobium sp. YS-1r TaxID=1532558 RepID=UPI000AB0998C|nr:hypothetical protein [Rhizobium sp. YS-1r]